MYLVMILIRKYKNSVVFLLGIKEAMNQFIKKVILGGLNTLTEKRFIFYLILSLLAFTVSTVNSILVYYGYRTYSLILENFEAATAICLIISGGMALILKRTVERIVETVVILSFLLIGLGLYRYSILFIATRIFISICFYGWILMLNIAAFSAIRNFIVSWSGRLVNFRVLKNAMLFEIPIKIVTLLSVIGFVFLGFGFLIEFGLSDLLAGISGLIAWLITSVIIFGWIKKLKNNVFASIIGLFFIFVVYHLILCIWNGIGSGIGSILIDSILIVAGALYIVQGVCRRLTPSNEQKTEEKKPIWEDGAVITLLGATLGYHASALAIFFGGNPRILIYNFHQYAILFDATILIGCVILFASSLRFRNYFSKKL